MWITHIKANLRCLQLIFNVLFLCGFLTVTLITVMDDNELVDWADTSELDAILGISSGSAPAGDNLGR